MNKPASLLLALLLISTAASAATAPNTETQKVVDELRALAAKARKERSADPWLLQAMDDLVQRNYWPWRHVVIDEKFSDGDFSKNPAWETATGKFWVDRSLGLRSKAVVTAAAPASKEKDKQKFRDALREAVLAEMAGQKPGNTPAATTTSVAEIYLPARITNSFALDASFSQHQTPLDPGVIEFGLFEGTRRDRGYVLAIVTGEENYAELQRITAKGVAIIDQEVLVNAPATGALQNLIWRREPSGAMTVSLDGKTLIQTQDRGLNAAFRSFGIANRVGDFAVKQVALSDAG